MVPLPRCEPFATGYHMQSNHYFHSAVIFQRLLVHSSIMRCFKLLLIVDDIGIESNKETSRHSCNITNHSVIPSSAISTLLLLHILLLDFSRRGLFALIIRTLMLPLFGPR